MRILVTGGAGFIGSHLVDRLLVLGHDVAIIDNLSTGRKENLNKNATFYNCDVCDPEIDSILKKEKPEIIFHLAAQISVRQSVEDPASDARANILGGLNLLKTAKDCNVKKFIFTSTGGAIYGESSILPTSETCREQPISPYGISKLSIEKYIYHYFKAYGMEYVILRLANVYGPRQNSKGESGVVAIFCDKILARAVPIISGNGRQTRDFVYIEDVVAAHIAAIGANKCEIFNIGTARETSVNEIFCHIKRFLGSDCEKIHGRGNVGEQMKSCLDNARAAEILGWRPAFGLELGLEKTAAWFKEKYLNEYIQES